MLKFYILEVALAGIWAGAWPLIMQRSGLSGATVAVVYGLVNFIFALLFWVAGEHGQVALTESSSWALAISAAALAAGATILLSDVIGKASLKDLSILYVIMLLTQISVPVIVFMVVNHGVSLKQGLGFSLAIIAAALLV